MNIVFLVIAIAILFVTWFVGCVFYAVCKTNEECKKVDFKFKLIYLFEIITFISFYYLVF